MRSRFLSALQSPAHRGLRRALAGGPFWVVALGAARLLRLVFYSPVLGYANNFDFHRVANWFGWVPVDRSISMMAMHAHAPLTEYATDGPRYPELVSSGLLHAELAAQIHRLAATLGLASVDRFDIRFLGGVRAAMLLMIIVVAVYRFGRLSRAAAWAIAFLFLVVLADPILSLFANTLYVEFDAVVFLVGACLALAYIALAQKLSWPSVIAAAGFLLLVGTSKRQYAFLPIVLLGVSSLAGLWRMARSARHGWLKLLLLLLTCSAPPPLERAWHADSQHMVAIRQSNAIMTWFYTVLPALRAPADVVGELGLPAECAGHVGKHWYMPNVDWRPCLAISDVSHVRLLWVLIREPRAFARVVARAVPKTAPALNIGMGVVAGRHHSGLETLHDPSLWGLGMVEPKLGRGVYDTALGFALAACGVSLLAWLWPFRRARLRPPAALPAVLGAAVVLYSFFSALLGAGYDDFSRHFIFGKIAVLPAIGLMVSVRCSRRERR